MPVENRPPGPGSPTSSRREFLKTGGKLAAGTALAGAAIPSSVADGEPFQRPAGTMPTRVLGKTGVEVGVLALGSIGATVDFPSDEEAVAFIRTCIDAGINYIWPSATSGSRWRPRSGRIFSGPWKKSA